MAFVSCAEGDGAIGQLFFNKGLTTVQKNIPLAGACSLTIIAVSSLFIVSHGSSLLTSMRTRRRQAASISKVVETKVQNEAVKAEVVNVQIANERILDSTPASDSLEKEKLELERRVAELGRQLSDASRNNQYLQKELDNRKQAEKTLAEQSQSFERKQTILELHVKARTDQLQSLQLRYERILNSAGEGICGLDPKGKIIFANPAAAKITGWTVEELVGKVECDELRRLQNQNGEETDMDGAFECEYFRKDGTPFLVERTRTRFFDGERTAGAVVIFKDITERKNVQAKLTEKAAELERSNSELEQFAFVASHDLQEPLRKLQAFADRLKTKCSGLDLGEGWDYLERMLNASARMQRLISDLLTFSRAIRTAQPFVPVDLNIVAKEVLNDLEVRIEQTKAVVKTEQLPTIDADPTQMRQLFQNLIGNALKFQRPDSVPEVIIRSKVMNEGSDKNDTAFISNSNPPVNGLLADGVCELTVADNGIGFDEKYSDRIFAVFQRLHGRTEYEGTGVGLAVCRRIADRHGGKITARSKPGQGSTFSVVLPLKQKAQKL